MGKMGALIDGFVQGARALGVEGHQGAVVAITDAQGDPLVPPNASWFCQDKGAGHSEMVLLNSSRVLERLQGDMRKVYLYTRFAPCPDCAAQLCTYPRTYAQTKFSLAYHDPLPSGAPYKINDVRAGIGNLVASGWKVRQWQSGEQRAAIKMTPAEGKAELTPSALLGEGSSTAYGDQADARFWAAVEEATANLGY
jgi:hypothetical protein